MIERAELDGLAEALAGGGGAALSEAQAALVRRVVAELGALAATAETQRMLLETYDVESGEVDRAVEGALRDVAAALGEGGPASGLDLARAEAERAALVRRLESSRDAAELIRRVLGFVAGLRALG